MQVWRKLHFLFVYMYGQKVIDSISGIKFAGTARVLAGMVTANRRLAIIMPAPDHAAGGPSKFNPTDTVNYTTHKYGTSRFMHMIASVEVLFAQSSLDDLQARFR